MERKQTASLTQDVQQHSHSKAEKQTHTMNKGDVESGEGKAAALSPASFSFVANFMLHKTP